MFFYGGLIPLGMNLVIALCILFPVAEKISGAKHLQIMTGLGPLTFWSVNFIWDYLLYIFSALMMFGALMTPALDSQHTFTEFPAPG